MSFWSWFSDYGQSAWAEDVEAAVAQADDWVDQVVASKDWPASGVSHAEQLITRSANSADDVREFWRLLAALWDSEPKDLPGWDKLGDTFSQAGGTARTVEEGREAGRVDVVVPGALQDTADDIGEAAVWMKKWGPYILGAALFLAVGIIAWNVSR